MTPATHQPSAGGQVHARVEIDLGERSYPILIGSSLLDDPATWSGEVQAQAGAGHLDQTEQLEGAVAREKVVGRGDGSPFPLAEHDPVDFGLAEVELVFPEVTALPVVVLLDLLVIGLTLGVPYQ